MTGSVRESTTLCRHTVDQIHKDGVMVIGYAPPHLRTPVVSQSQLLPTVSAIFRYEQNPLSYFPARAHHCVYTPQFPAAVTHIFSLFLFSEPFILHFLKRKVN